jgi:tRNA (mo5U34)-methyltransferase
MASTVLKKIALRIPAVRDHYDRVRALIAERDRLVGECERWRASAAAPHAETTSAVSVDDDWSACKQRRAELSADHEKVAAFARLTPFIDPVHDALDKSLAELVRHQVSAEPYWFQRIEVAPGLFSPGWSDPATDKLPYYGLPEDLTGKRVLDIGCAEGFFSFEAERRGAREVIGIDSFPDSVRRFNIVKASRQSNANAFLMNVYDLEPKRLGTFDVVLFYGVFYHLKHPQLALERILSVCTGDLRFQTYMHEEPSVRGTPWARYYPHGKMSGGNKELFDPTVFWLFNSACCLAMLDHVGFTDLRVLSTDPFPFVVSASVPQPSAGRPPNQSDSPWC